MTNQLVTVDEQGGAVAPTGGPVALFGSADPVQIVAHARTVANALADVVAQQNLFTEIRGRRHVRVEGWTLLGSMLGVFPLCAWSRPIDRGWEARVEARTLAGALVGAAEAQCTRDEDRWADQPDYALRSMAQTRATSKAMRLPLGFVISLAGYDATPAEEMDGIGGDGGGSAAPRAERANGGNGRIPHAPAHMAQAAEGRPVLPATEPQIRAIYASGRNDRGLDDAEIEARCQERFGVPVSGLSRRQASEFIDALKSGSG